MHMHGCFPHYVTYESNLLSRARGSGYEKNYTAHTLQSLDFLSYHLYNHLTHFQKTDPIDLTQSPTKKDEMGYNL
ncbi:hypothetical protein LOK49_LG03G00919 [Camellia lanceoleosa]|uniref:Uncharacterized protein n=1 Tax=Camellia lanceoleosa TaxID=1840588 RepID=A0ACC0IBJ1_9ERIC|nr:hypothetical protein LOK49_LG03G00919 [Camellia lanceoleosa]